VVLKRFYDDDLAQASFLVGCTRTGEAIVIDANRDVQQYIDAAEEEGLKITAVTETHIHADYLSGSRELAEVTGAKLYLSDEGDAEWKYGFANQPNVVLVRDGDVIRVGSIRFNVVKTPGHTPEHITFVVTDEASTDRALGAFTGDFIFVGDVGRPDLLERAAGFAGTMEAGARTLYQSLQRFKRTMPLDILVFPGHGAGSACGKNLGGVPVSTLGYEVSANWGLRDITEEEFTKTVLEGQPDPPAYFKEMKRINRDGPPILGGFRLPVRKNLHELLDVLKSDAVVLDVRAIKEFADGFIPGTMNIPLGGGFTKWAGWLIPYDVPIYLIAKSESDVLKAVRNLAMIGLDNVQGWCDESVLREFGKLEQVTRMSSEEVSKKTVTDNIRVLDVRHLDEYLDGHVPNAIHVPLGYLSKRINEVPKDKPIVVHCASEMRSAVAVSILRKHDFEHVYHMNDGFDAYERNGFVVERGGGAKQAVEV
jgi:hydroxyacylglutathione hydrolase